MSSFKVLSDKSNLKIPIYLFVYWSINVPCRKCLQGMHKIIKINNKQYERKTSKRVIGYFEHSPGGEIETWN